MELWFTEKQTPQLGITCKVRNTLHRERSAFQDIAVLDTEQFGRLLALDGIIQTSEADEFVYHEMIVHVAMCTHPSPRRVMVVGGGDGGTVREVLKHPRVERVELVEIDERVVEVCRELLPGLSSSLNDPRARVVIADGIRYMEEAGGEFDVVLVDSTDPIGPAVGLFSPEFYASVYRRLSPEGIMVAQTESPFFNRDLIREVFSAVRGIFPLARLYLASIPTYPSGLWSFTLGSKAFDPLEVSPERSAALSTRYYSPEVHRAAFALPGFVRELLE